MDTISSALLPSFKCLKILDAECDRSVRARAVELKTMFRQVAADDVGLFHLAPPAGR